MAVSFDSAAVSVRSGCWRPNACTLTCPVSTEACQHFIHTVAMTTSSCFINLLTLFETFLLFFLFKKIKKTRTHERSVQFQLVVVGRES